MNTIVFSKVTQDRFLNDGDAVVKQFSSDKALREFFLDDLRRPIAATKFQKVALAEKVLPLSTRQAPDPHQVELPNGDLEDCPVGGGGESGSSEYVEWFRTVLWENANYSGKSVKLSNIMSSFDVEWRLSDNGLNDRVTSVKVGRAVACVVLFQHSYLRGERLWLIGGNKPSKADLSKIPFSGGGNWNDRISSAIAATISPVEVLSRIISFGLF